MHRQQRHLAHRLDDPSRRQFLAQTARAMLGVAALPWLPSLSAEEPLTTTTTPFIHPRATRVINLFMAGGMCHFDSFDPKRRLKSQGASVGIPTSADDLQFGAHLPQLARLAHEMTVIRSMTTTQGAHEQGQYYLRTGYVARGTIRHPSLGAWADRLSGRRNPTLPGSVVIGSGSNHPAGGFLASTHAPLVLGAADDGLPHSAPFHTVSHQRQQRRREILHQLEQAQRSHLDKGHQAYQALYQEAQALMDSNDLKAFHISAESQDTRTEYGESRFGLACLLARRLVEHDVRFVEVTLGGWDTHVDHAERAADQLRLLDQSASALIRDLKQRGLLESTIVMITTEFGRTPVLNLNNGRDHHPGVFSCALAGGPFCNGMAYGSSDERGDRIAEHRVLVPDLHATVGYAMGLPVDNVIYSDSVRPFTVGDKGRVMSEWFA